jgi:phosphoribosylaminoimidazole carboxylase PurE protein
MQPLVGIVMGSDSDFSVMQEALRQLENLSIPFEVTVSSAHRSPHRTAEYARTARSRGIRVIIAAAGWAAHLAGVIASETTLPVIGVPIDSSPLKGLDSLLATVQMPGGVPVATMALGAQGARNAAVLAAQILALSDTDLHDRLAAYKASLSDTVARSNDALQQKLNGR